MSDNWNWHDDPLYQRNVWWDYQQPGVLVRIADDLARVHSALISELTAAKVLVPIGATSLLQSSWELVRRVVLECKVQEEARREQGRLYQRLIEEGLCP